MFTSQPSKFEYHSGYQGHVQVYGTEYQITTGSPIDQSHNCNIPCSLCQSYRRTNKIMIPSHYECPPEWNTEYYGYLMAGGYGHNAATQFTCMDRSLEQIPGSAARTYGKFFYNVEAYCGHFIPCSDNVWCVPSN